MSCDSVHLPHCFVGLYHETQFSEPDRHKNFQHSSELIGLKSYNHFWTRIQINKFWKQRFFYPMRLSANVSYR